MLNQIPDAREIVHRPRRRRFASQPWSSGADWSPVLWQQPKCLPPRCVNPQRVLSCSNFTFFLHACTVWTFLPGLPPGNVFMCSSALWAHNHALLKMSSCLWTQIANQPTAGQRLSAFRYVVKRTWCEHQRAKRGLKWLHDITTISGVYRETVPNRENIQCAAAIVWRTTPCRCPESEVRMGRLIGNRRESMGRYATTGLWSSEGFLIKWPESVFEPLACFTFCTCCLQSFPRYGHMLLDWHVTLIIVILHHDCSFKLYK